MSNSSDLDFLKDIPGYKAIMKSVIKSQIQLLIEQLSDQTGEESIILTASINEGTLSHLGSNMGKGFFEGRDEIKSQFLGYCLKNHHNSRDDLLPRTLYQEDNISDRYQPSPSAKRQKVQAVSLPRKDQDYEVPGMQQSYQSQSPQGNPLFVPRTPTRVPTKKRPASSTSTPTQNSPSIPLNTDNNSVVKAEGIGDIEDTDTVMRLPIVSSSEIAEHPANIPHPVRLSHAQSHPPVGEETDSGGQLKDPDPSRLAHTGDDSQGPIVKMEPDMENENDLEITGVETTGMAPGFSGDWGQDVSGGMGYMPSDPGDSSFDQLGGHQSARRRIKRPRKQSGDEVFQCTLCEKVFKFQSLLDRHWRSHTGEKPFKCDVCFRSFRQQAHLDQHVRSHGVAVLKCDYCGADFETRRQFNVHSETCPPVPVDHFVPETLFMPSKLINADH